MLDTLSRIISGIVGITMLSLVLTFFGALQLAMFKSFRQQGEVSADELLTNFRYLLPRIMGVIVGFVAFIIILRTVT